jgi:XisI protein
MDSLMLNEAKIVRDVLLRCAAEFASPEARILPLFDEDHGQFALVEEGWDGYHRLYNPLIHLEFARPGWRILADYTERGVAPELLRAGIPAERIELSYKHPTLRPERLAA